jgi:hypothetical protein
VKGGRATRPENKDPTRKWIGQEFLAAKLNQGVNALSSIDALDRHQNAHRLQHRY